MKFLKNLLALTCVCIINTAFSTTEAELNGLNDLSKAMIENDTQAVEQILNSGVKLSAKHFPISSHIAVFVIPVTNESIAKLVLGATDANVLAASMPDILMNARDDRNF